VEGAPNSQLAIKVLKPHTLDHPLGRDAPKHIVTEQERLKALGIDVAEIYNKGDFMAGCGYQVVEYVHFPVVFFPVPTALALMECVYQHGLCPDVKVDNLRLRQGSSTPAIVDFREIPTNAANRNATFVAMIRDLDGSVSPGLVAAACMSLVLSKIYCSGLVDTRGEWLRI